ncbi:MAG: DNA polymerase IV [Aestuariibacter sp.]
MRKIIHIDMDCFYAAVEMRDNPALQNIPIAIGGSSDRRGVIATCNYPARQYGVRSAMATAQAMKLCPQLTLVKGRMDVYIEESKRIRAILLRYADKIEPLSLDEAYLDVTDSPMFAGSATRIAQAIRQDIETETGLTASAGVAPLKFVAKVASDENKPNGICVVTPETLDDFVAGLPLKKIPGVGKVTQEKLNRLGLYTCADIQKTEQKTLIERFGKYGKVLWHRCHGIDERGISTERVRKSVGIETTLSQDIYTQEQVWQVISGLLPKLKTRLKKANNQLLIHNQGIKLKFSDFQQTTIEKRTSELNLSCFKALLTEIMSRQNQRGIRLVGLHVSLPTEADNRQLKFSFDELETSSD